MLWQAHIQNKNCEKNSCEILKLYLCRQKLYNKFIETLFDHYVHQHYFKICVAKTVLLT